MSLKVVSLFTQAPRPRNWSNQELAEFYRVQASLSRAGVSVETDQGLTDEGDPWFVFCGSDSGDVIIHFARIDGMYMVASPAFGSCVHGRDFRALIEGLMEQHPVVMPREKEKGKFFIHPAALLVALVATAFFKLCQGDALAAEGSEDSLPHQTLAGSGSRSAATASAQSHMIALDERSAATLLVAVAAAVAWEQATGTDDSGVISTSSHVVEAALTAATPVDGPTVHASLQPSALENGHLSDLPAEVHVQDPADMAIAPTAVVTAQVADTFAPQARVSNEPGTPVSGGDQLQVADASPVNPAFPVPRQAEVVAEHQPQSSAAQEKAATDSVTPSSSAALSELKAVVGDLLATHLASNVDNDEQHLILSLANPVIPAHDTAPVDHAAAPATADTSAKPADTPAAVTTDSGFSASTTTTPTTTTATIVQTTSVTASADDAIHQFMAEHTDFLIMKYDREVIMYDPSLTPSNAAEAQQEVFSFSDGSSLMLIGLPAHSTTTSLV